MIAHEFLKVMHQAQVKDVNGRIVSPEGLNWPEIIQTDDLQCKPIQLIREIRDNIGLADRILRFRRLFGKQKQTREPALV